MKENLILYQFLLPRKKSRNWQEFWQELAELAEAWHSCSMVTQATRPICYCLCFLLRPISLRIPMVLAIIMSTSYYIYKLVSYLSPDWTYQYLNTNPNTAQYCQRFTWNLSDLCISALRWFIVHPPVQCHLHFALVSILRSWLHYYYSYAIVVNVILPLKVLL